MLSFRILFKQCWYRFFKYWDGPLVSVVCWRSLGFCCLSDGVVTENGDNFSLCDKQVGIIFKNACLEYKSTSPIHQSLILHERWKGDGKVLLLYSRSFMQCCLCMWNNISYWCSEFAFVNFTSSELFLVLLSYSSHSFNEYHPLTSLFPIGTYVTMATSRVETSRWGSPASNALKEQPYSSP